MSFTQTFEELLADVATDETRERHRAQIRKFTEESFKDHILTEESPNVFRCAKPGTGYYSFRVTFLPAE